MTKKEFNAFRKATYDHLIADSEIRRTVESYGQAHLYEMVQGDKHGFHVFGYKTHISSRNIADLGYDPAKVNIRCVVSLRGDIRCADLHSQFFMLGSEVV